MGCCRVNSRNCTKHFKLSPLPQDYYVYAMIIRLQRTEKGVFVLRAEESFLSMLRILVSLSKLNFECRSFSCEGVFLH